MVDNKELALMANKLRIHSIRATTAAGSGHPTSCLSVAEIMSTLFFSQINRSDEFILSKGHAAPILWAVYAESNLIPREELMNLRKISSDLEGHPTKRMPCTKIATGSLGQGLSAGVGMALAKRLKREDSMVYVLMGDGETAEGSVWEAANCASNYMLSNLCVIIDVNRLGQSQPTMHGHDVDVYSDKFEAFGWNTYIVDGHSIKDLQKAFNRAKKSGRPTAIIAKTLKGKGILSIEDKEGYHGKPISEENLAAVLEEIGPADIKLPARIKKCKPIDYKYKDAKTNEYQIGENVATRDAFGRALVCAASKNPKIVAIDGDVRNSTKMDLFFQKYLYRSFESFISEQNMIGMSLGLSSQGFLPYVASFATFFTRAHDFIRMAQYSDINIQIVGSHVGVSIGQDGPSQMGLEDISMYLSMAESVILSPCDAVSAEQLTIAMPTYRGVSYLRTIREKTPVIYKNTEEFEIGGLKVIKKSNKDKALVIAHGITVHEALKAHEVLKTKKISIRIIDLYSIKPIDAKAIRKNAEECKGNVIVVEDHYKGGAGSVVSEIVCKMTHLYVKDIPRSGKPAELRKMHGIDHSAIVKAVKDFK